MSTPKHPASRAGPSRGRSSLLQQLDGNMPATLPRTTKREPIERQAPTSVPSKRRRSVKKEDDTGEVIDLTTEEDLGPARKVSRTVPLTLKREEAIPIDVDDEDPVPIDVDADDEEVIDLTMDDIPAPSKKGKGPMAPMFTSKREEAPVTPGTSLAPAQPPLPPAPADTAPPPTGPTLDAARLNQRLATIRREQTKLGDQINQLRRRIRLGGGQAASQLLTDKLKQVAALIEEEKIVRAQLSEAMKKRFPPTESSPLAAKSEAGTPNVAKKEEPSSDGDWWQAYAPMTTAGPSRPGSNGLQPSAIPPRSIQPPTLPAGGPIRPPPDIKPFALPPGVRVGPPDIKPFALPTGAYTGPPSIQPSAFPPERAGPLTNINPSALPHGVHSGPPSFQPYALPSGVRAGPPVPQPPGAYPGMQPIQAIQNPFGYLANNAAQQIGNGLHAGLNAMQHFAHVAAGYMPGGNAIGQAMHELVGAGAPAFGRGRPWDDNFEDVDDAYMRRDADAVNKFIIAAGNADVFDANASVQKAMKGLGLENQQQLLPGMECNLLPHQLIAVKWMYDLETDAKFKRSGGILADEMGLGKTVQMIALMCKNPAPEDEPRRANLVIAPLSLLEQWKEEIKDKTEGHLKIHIYHQSNPWKAKTKNWLEQHDVVITTYGTLAGELPKGMMQQQKPKADELEQLKKKAGILYKAKWHRIILDEAHNIRNRPTRQSQAVTHLDAKYRWCLTGTPVINSLGDLYGYFRFIRLRPWDNWADYNDHVVRLQKKQPNLASERAQHILQICLLRRKKDSMLDGKRLIELTNKEVVQLTLDFSHEERQIYEYVQGKVQAVFNRYLRAGTVLKNYSHILVLILRLKQLCCHPALIQEQRDDPAIVSAGDDEKAQMDEVQRAVRLMGQPWVDQLKAKLLVVMSERVKTEKRSLDEEVDNDLCPVCFDTMSEPVVTACSHIYCRDCVEKLFEKPMEPCPEYKADERPCPSCRAAVSLEKLFSRCAFEPSDRQLDELIGKPDKKIKRQIKDESDDDIDMPSVNELMDLGLSPRKPKKHSKIKQEVKKSKKGRKAKREVRSESEDNSEGSMEDFIVHTDEDEDEKDRRKAQKKRKDKGKGRAEIKPEPVSDSEPIVIDDSSDESEEDVKPNIPKMMLKGLPKMSKFLPSTKMKRMMESIKTWAEVHPTDKTMVLSQFTSCLDLVARYLDENEVSYVRYQGDMRKNERDESVRVFQRKRGGPRVMLMSLKAGGVGLNLTRANRVIAMDLAWSEAVENQAYDRVHRLGQTKDVRVERLIIKNSIEDELLKIQARKRALADGSLGEGAGRKIGRLSVREIAALFGIHDLRRH